MSLPLKTIAVVLLMTVVALPPAFAGDAVLVPDEAAEVNNIHIPDDVTDRDYFARKAAREAKAKNAVRTEFKAKIETQQAARAAAMARDQQAIDARVDAVVSQPGDYATRINGLKTAPPTGPETLPPADEDTDEPQINPGPGDTGDLTGGGPSRPGRETPESETRSVLDQMMDAIQ